MSWPRESVAFAAVAPRAVPVFGDGPEGNKRYVLMSTGSEKRHDVGGAQGLHVLAQPMGPSRNLHILV
jgi:hypothetical protein